MVVMMVMVEGLGAVGFFRGQTARPIPDNIARNDSVRAVWRAERETVAAENARQGLEQLKIKELATPKALEAALAEIERELKLKNLPLRMEAYDISNIQGKSAVGSMVS